MGFITAGSLVPILVALLVVRIVYSQWRQSRYLAKYPWLGTDGKLLFPRIRARVYNTMNFKDTIRMAYQKYSLSNQTFVLPTLSDSLIMLPPDHMAWIINQPDEILSSEAPHIENLQSDLTFSHPHIVRDPTHHMVVSRELTRQLGNLTEDIIDELSNATDLLWPCDETQFRDVRVFDSFMAIVARTTNRIFVGFPLCRNEEYLNLVSKISQEIPKGAAILRLFPGFARTTVAKVLMAKNRKYMNAYIATIRPEIVRRQAAMADSEKASRISPNDLLQWLINNAEDLGGIERDPDIIAGRLIALNFAANHTTVFSITNALFDLVSTKPEARCIEQLREEAEAILAEGGGVWTRSGLAKMYKIDSALRESSRVGSFLGPGMLRTVMVKEGVTSPNGTHCPYGSNVAIPSVGIHNDPAYYVDSANYDPFRFHRERTAVEASEKTKEGDYITKANLAFVSTSPTYHPFGHGKHACPGRFFAANELKLLMSYLVLNYDFELLRERPESKWLGPVLVPPMDSSIRVRRRKAA